MNSFDNGSRYCCENEQHEGNEEQDRQGRRWPEHCPLSLLVDGHNVPKTDGEKDVNWEAAQGRVWPQA